jgi:hypothetical protein
MGVFGGPVETPAGEELGVVCRGMPGWLGDDGAAPWVLLSKDALASTSEGRLAKRRMLRRN